VLPPAGTTAAEPTPAQLPPLGPHRRGRWPVVLGLVVAALLVILLVHAFGSAATSTPGTGSTSPKQTATSSAASQIRVVAADYVGKPADQVSSALVAKGLKVSVTRAAGGGPVGTVKAVSPTGPVAKGTTIGLTVVSAAPTTSAGNGPVKKHGKDNGKGTH
jgi:eukaryotic-like serine/threonine-protein kinase